MQRLKSLVNLAHVPVIVVSASDPATKEQPARDAGAHAFFPKPIDMDALLAEIRRLLGEEDGTAGDSGPP